MPNNLADKYYESEARPATATFDYRVDPSLPDDFLPDGRGFCLRNVLSQKECDELIALAEADGIVPPQKAAGTLRTAKRTDQYQNEELSRRIEGRIKDTINAKLMDANGGDENKSNAAAAAAATEYFGDFHGIHSNWRIVRYDSGDSFCAHQDQMDSIQLKKPDGTKDLVVSSHTLLINLSPEKDLVGGATRFYPDSRINCSDGNQYENTLDVYLPRGWAIAFRQKGLVHAGQPIKSGIKYVAQAGILRHIPPTKSIRPSVFRLASGLEEIRDSQYLQ